MASQQPDAGAVTGGQPGDRLPAPGHQPATSQVPFTPVTAEALAKLTPIERGAFTMAAELVADDQKPSMGTVVALVETIQRLIAVAAQGEDGSEEKRLRERPGDQQLPVPNDGPSMHDLVIADLGDWTAPRSEIEAIAELLRERKQLGLERYGSLLQCGNGRSWRRDLREELADAAAYARLGLEETGSDDAPGDLGEVYDHILSALFWLEKIPGAAS